MDTNTICKLLTLSQIYIDEDERDSLVEDLEHILHFIEEMRAVDTANIEPLAHPVDLEQPMRSDNAVRDTDPSLLQLVAPVVRDQFYIVPRVITSRWNQVALLTNSVKDWEKGLLARLNSYKRT